MTRMGPNDARRVVWVLGMFFFRKFLFFLYYLIIFRFNLCFDIMRRVRRVAMTRIGPNDARRVVWAIGMCFFYCTIILFHFYYFDSPHCFCVAPLFFLSIFQFLKKIAYTVVVDNNI